MVAQDPSLGYEYGLDRCPKCGLIQDQLVKAGPGLHCQECGEVVRGVMGRPNYFESFAPESIRADYAVWLETVDESTLNADEAAIVALLRHPETALTVRAAALENTKRVLQRWSAEIYQDAIYLVLAFPGKFYLVATKDREGDVAVQRVTALAAIAAIPLREAIIDAADVRDWRTAWSAGRVPDTAWEWNAEFDQFRLGQRRRA